MKKLLLATAAALIATSALATVSPKEQGNIVEWVGNCGLTVAGADQEKTYCLKKMWTWMSHDKQRYAFSTSFKISGVVVSYDLVGEHAFYTPEGEPDTFLIDEIWATKTVNGKDVKIVDKASGKCTTFFDTGTLYVDCKVKGKKSPAIAFKFNGEEPKEDKKDNDGESNATKPEERGA